MLEVFRLLTSIKDVKSKFILYVSSTHKMKLMLVQNNSSNTINILMIPDSFISALNKIIEGSHEEAFSLVGCVGSIHFKDKKSVSMYELSIKVENINYMFTPQLSEIVELYHKLHNYFETESNADITSTEEEWYVHFVWNDNQGRRL